MARILIVEDDFTIRQSVEYALKRAGFEVKSLDNGTQAPQTIADFEPDLIILDLMLPGLSGFEITESLRAQDSETALIMISALGQDSDKITGLNIGADDYLTKPFSLDELVARVQANLRRVRAKELLRKQETIHLGDLTINPRAFSVHVGNRPVELRAKEFQLLWALASKNGELSTRETLAEEVWGYEHLTSSRTIDVHIRRLRQVVEEPSAYHYIQTVHGMGYRFVPMHKEDSPEEIHEV